MTMALPPLPESALIDYFGTTMRLGERAALWEQTYRIGAFAVRVVSPGREVFRLMTRALDHLPDAGGETADLTITLWAGDPVPPSPFAWYEQHMGAEAAAQLRTTTVAAHGELPVFNTGRIRTALHLYPNGLQMFDSEGANAVEWIESAEAVPYYVRSAPFHHLFSWAFNRPGSVIVHGGAVGLETGGVLFIGDSGMGKTTSTMACIGSSLRYAGDDYCLVDVEAPYVYSLYQSAKLKGEADVDRFPALRRLIDNPMRPPQDKALIFMQDLDPAWVSSGFPLRALVIPRRVASSHTPRSFRVTGSEALAAVAPSTLAQQPGSRAPILRALAALTTKVPAYVMEVNEDIRQIPAQVERLLREEGAV